jgi:hypothetical protein
MPSWFRTQIDQYGPTVAAVLIARVLWSRARVEFLNRVLPATVECPCCGWRGRRFLDYIEVGYTVPNSACPRCDSHSRHRAFYLWLQRTYQLNTRKGFALIFAPEPALKPLWDEAKNLRSVRVDVATARDVDLLANAENLAIADESLELVWCHHVLEHVEHDRQAIAELARVLRRGVGELIVSVPMEQGTETHEYGFADPHQSGHWRMYGDDFVSRLTEQGLTVETREHELTPEVARGYGIVPERFYVCRKQGRHEMRAHSA